MICKACGLDHLAFGLRAGDQCGRVRFLAAMRAPALPTPVVVHAPVVHPDTQVVVHSDRKRDRHANTAARREYKREHERRRRAAAAGPARATGG